MGKILLFIVYNVDLLSEMFYYVISGGCVFNYRYLVLLIFVVSCIRLSYVIVMMGSNDLDFVDLYFNVECFVFWLIVFLI